MANTDYNTGDTITVTRPDITQIPAGTHGTVTHVIPIKDGVNALWITHDGGANLAYDREVDPA